MPKSKKATISKMKGGTKSSACLKANGLKKGDAVAIVAPSSRAEGDQAVARASRVLSEMGFKPQVGKHVLSIHGYMAGTDDERSSDFNNFVKDPSIKAIFCITGGYGALRILDRLDYSALAANPKIIVGCDENTSLLLAINKMTGLVCFHGFNLESIDSQTKFDELRKSITQAGVLPPVEAEPSFPPGFIKVAHSGHTEGITLGGNFASLSSMIGTRHQPVFDDKILFLEDHDERVDVLERWLTNLYLSGQLQRTKGVAFGRFDNCGIKGSSNMFSLEESLTERLVALKKPSCFGMAIGQASGSRIIPIGIRAAFDSGKAILTFQEPALIK